MSERIDLTGMKFGMVYVKSYSHTGKYFKAWWNCVCDCGKEFCVLGESLRNGKTTSCGCMRGGATHRLSKSRIYKIFSGMHNRCINNGSFANRNYGNRGIKVCEEWSGKNGFETFYKWSMENGYNDELTIDRINPNGNYEPDNCRWTTESEQANNKQNTRFVEYKGEIISYANLARKVNMPYSLLSSRLVNGWDVEVAINTPKLRNRKQKINK